MQSNNLLIEDSDNNFIEDFNNNKSSLYNSSDNDEYSKNNTIQQITNNHKILQTSFIPNNPDLNVTANFPKETNVSLSPKVLSLDKTVPSIINKKEMLNVTTSIDINDNDIPDFITSDISKKKEIKQKIKKKSKRKIIFIKNKNSKKMSGNNNKKPYDIYNGWNHDVTSTITKWFIIFKKYSFIYQWVLDRNKQIADRLGMISIISSSMLGIFSGFKLWIDNDKVFQISSNIILMLLNFIVALITAISKQYIDNNRNIIIKKYIEEVDKFRGEISAELLKPIAYRINANEFLELNNDKYTKLISLAPNLSLFELKEGKIKFKNYQKHIDDQV